MLLQALKAPVSDHHLPHNNLHSSISSHQVSTAINQAFYLHDLQSNTPPTKLAVRKSRTLLVSRARQASSVASMVQLVSMADSFSQMANSPCGEKGGAGELVVRWQAHSGCKGTC